MNIDRKLRILIVDDMQMIRQTLANILRKDGFQNLAYASNGQLALDEVTSSRFGLILLDWNMPGMTGIDFLRKLRTIEGYETTPVVMITAENQLSRVQEAAFAGVSGYLLKPFTPKAVREKIFEALGASL